MKALYFFLRRSLFPSGGGFLSYSLWVSAIGVSLGIILLMVVLAVMTGFQSYLESHYVRITSDLVVIPKSEGTALRLRNALISTEGIEAVSPLAFGQGMVLKNGVVGGITLEGIDWELMAKVTPLHDVWVEPPRPSIQKNPYWIWLGVQLAKKLNVKVGDEVDLLIVEGDRKKIVPFSVSAITKFGIYDHDLRYAKIHIDTLKDIFRSYQLEPLYKCKIKKPFSIQEVSDNLRSVWGKEIEVREWFSLNRNIFKAVHHQKRMLFLILEILVALSAMNVVNLLMMSSHFRRKDMAILRAMGFRFKDVVFYFLSQGGFVSLVGILLGVGGGSFACLLIDRFQPNLLRESIYNSPKLPILIDWSDVGLITGSAFLLCLIFSVLPSLRAATEKPVESLRYE